MNYYYIKSNTKVNKKNFHTIFLVIFSLLFLLGAAGLIVRLIDGNNLSSCMPVIILMLLSALITVINICGLKGRPLIKISAALIFSYAQVLLFLFFIGSGIYILVRNIRDFNTKDLIMGILITVFGIFGTNLTIRYSITRTKNYIYNCKLTKNNGITTAEDKQKLIDSIMNQYQMYTLFVPGCNSDFPFIDDAGEVALYDSKDSMDRLLREVSFNRKIVFYHEHCISSEKLSRTSGEKLLKVLSKWYDVGIKKFYYITPLGETVLNTDDFEIEKSNDLLYDLNTEFLFQNIILEQKYGRYSYMTDDKKGNFHEVQISEARENYEKQLLNTKKNFCNSLFYVLCEPISDADIGKLSYISLQALTKCPENIIEELKTQNVRCVSGIQPVRFRNDLCTFSRYEKAKDFFNRDEQPIEKQLAESLFDKPMSEEDRAELIKLYLQEAETLKKCTICIMTGKETEKMHVDRIL